MKHNSAQIERKPSALGLIGKNKVLDTIEESDNTLINSHYYILSGIKDLEPNKCDRENLAINNQKEVLPDTMTEIFYCKTV